MATLYLTPDGWDLALDASRSIAIATYPYEQAQTVANACRLWKGEAPYNTNRGILYDTEVLGKQPPQRVLAGWYETEAVSVGCSPSVASAVAVLQYADRALSGQIQCTLDDGTVINV